MWAPLDSSGFGRLGRTEPEFGSHAGQLGTGQSAYESAVHLIGHPASLPREFEIVIMVEVLIGEMFGSD